MRHSKVIGLAKALRIRRSYLIGHLHALWHAALEQREDGDLSQWSDETIAGHSDYPGNAPQYVQLLLDHGFLRENRLLHDWFDYAGRYLKRKYETSNPEKLAEIMIKHGLEPPERRFSDTKATQHKITVHNKNIKPSAPKGAADVFEIPDDLKPWAADIEAWLKYKSEKKQGYKPAGLAALFDLIRKIPPTERKDSISFSMSANWAGIYRHKETLKVPDRADEYEQLKKAGRCQQCREKKLTVKGVTFCPVCDRTKYCPDCMAELVSLEGRSSCPKGCGSAEKLDIKFQSMPKKVGAV